jgi:transposase-like protein
MQYSTEMPTDGVNSRPARPDRQKYTDAFKLQLVRQCLQPGVSVSGIARRHNVNSNVLFRWRKEYREGLLRDDRPREGAAAGAEFVGVGVINGKGGVTLLPPPKPPAQAEVKYSPDTAAKEKSPVHADTPGMIEICLSNGILVCVTTPFDDGELRRVLDVASRVPGEQ